MKNLSKTEIFINKANIVHQDAYDYSETVYTKSADKIVILCPTHGRFEQRASTHLNGSGCKECGIIKAANKHRKTTESFIDDSYKVHGNKYNYSKSVYVHNAAKLIITCPIHGDFEQSPSGHLQGQGCQKCAVARSPQMNIKSTETFIEEVSKIHNNFYSYAKVVYEGVNKNIIATCPKHGDFKQIASNHLRGSGCPECVKYGFNPNKPAILYYLKITTEDNQELYKIGITNRTVNERFSLTDLKKIEVLKQKVYENGQEALDKEKETLKKYSEYNYKGPKVLESGNTELFTVDIIDV